MQFGANQVRKVEDDSAVRAHFVNIFSPKDFDALRKNPALIEKFQQLQNNTENDENE